MLSKLKDAALGGLLFAVRWGVALLGLALVSGALLGDYQVVRQHAANGQAAYDFIKQQISTQQAGQAGAAPTGK